MRIKWEFFWTLLVIYGVIGGCDRRRDLEIEATTKKEESSVNIETHVKSRGRVIILGFDGVDPDLLEQWKEELPNIKGFINNRQLKRLKSVVPPQSPVAWISFATGTYPGSHGIYDFLRRDPKSYIPRLGVTEVIPRPIGPPIVKSYRQGVSFWQYASKNGVKVRVLNIPYIFPPEELHLGEMLSGLGVPDLRNTNSSFTLFGTDIPEEKLKEPARGGIFVPLELKDGEAEALVEGMYLGEDEGRVSTRLRFVPDFNARTVDVIIEDGKRIKLTPDNPTEWVELTLRSKTRKFFSIVRFYLVKLKDKDFRVYMTPLCYHPEEPYTPISYPITYAGRLKKEYGYYNTVGWKYDTSALSEGALTDEQFLNLVLLNMYERERIILSELKKGGFDLFIGVFTATDRVAHMFYRYLDKEHPLYNEEGGKKYGDAIKNIYKEMDRIIGEVKKLLNSEDKFIIISDHGFHSFRRGVHITTWLLENGYLVLKNNNRSTTPYYIIGLDDDKPYGIDWSKTKAYALGTGQIYINLRGREPKGIVDKKDYESLVEEIKTKLLGLEDKEKGGRKVISNIYTRKDVWYKGEREEEMPDIQIGFQEGYETSWESRTGAVPPPPIIVDNRDRWSGEHAANDVRDTEGILITNFPVKEGDPEIVDIAPTVLNFFGIKVPQNYIGKSLFE